MTTLLLSFALLLCVILAMSVGVLLGRKPIKGSCGGMSALGMKTSCDICGGKPSSCDREKATSTAANDLGYELSTKD